MDQLPYTQKKNSRQAGLKAMKLPLKTAVASSFISIMRNLPNLNWTKSTSYGDFSIVQNFLDPDGSAYKESKDYIKYSSEKGITEELLALTIGNIEAIDENNVKVFASEEYDITYGDGTTKYKKFVSSYQLTLVDGEYLVHKLLSTEEVDEF
jgi:hypothetical protein